MKEYIEREAAIAEIEEWRDMYPDSDAAREALSLVKRAVRKIPAADVREVVLCRECKYYRQDAEFADEKDIVREWYCPIHEAEFAEDAFCSYGRLDAERRN